MTINMARSTETKEVGLSIGLCVGSTTKVRNISHHPTPTLNFFYPRDSTGTSTHPLVDPRGKVMDDRNPEKAQKGPVETFSLIGWYTRWSDVEIMRWRSRILSTVCQTFRAECLTRRPTVDQRISPVVLRIYTNNSQVPLIHDANPSTSPTPDSPRSLSTGSAEVPYHPRRLHQALYADGNKYLGARKNRPHLPGINIYLPTTRLLRDPLLDGHHLAPRRVYPHHQEANSLGEGSLREETATRYLDLHQTKASGGGEVLGVLAGTKHFTVKLSPPRGTL